jgi:molybdopterin/thiamine biosynthesis adenylyltransferase
VSETLQFAARAELDRTLKGIGFRQTGLDRGAPIYEGAVASGQRKILIALIVEDVLFTQAPRVRITDPAITAQIRAHLDEAGDFCYISSHLEEYDPYNAGGAVLRCLESVRETLDLVLHGNPRADLQREFLSYWHAGSYIYADLPGDFVGAAEVHVRKDEVGGGFLVTTPSRAKAWRSRLTNAPVTPALIVRAAKPLLSTKGESPGATLESFKTWASPFFTTADLEKIVSPSTADGSLVVVAAENGSIGFRFEWPAVESQAFLKAAPLRRHAWIQAHPSRMTLKRYAFHSVDRSTMVNARLREKSALESLSIAVIGCGTVGSRIILDLVRSGAGAPGHPLILVDPDMLRAANLGRHVLGVDALDTPKSEAMAIEARRFHPEVEVLPIEMSVLDCLRRIERCDLIVDATGHNPLALRLNEIALDRRRRGGQFPPIVHAAVHGNGLAAQTILVTDTAHACLKCLRPGHGNFKANPIRPGLLTDMVPAACGDGAYIPYAAAAPAIAGALAVQAVLEWATAPDQPGPRVRTRRLDQDRTVPINDRNWGVDPACPACGRPTAHD